MTTTTAKGKDFAGDRIPNWAVIGVHVDELKQLFDAIHPSPLHHSLQFLVRLRRYVERALSAVLYFRQISECRNGCRLARTRYGPIGERQP
jgi:hypothetical protein